MPMVVDISSRLWKDAASITADDSNDVSGNPIALFIGTGGDVVVKTLSGNSVTFKNMGDASYIEGPVKRLMSTGTTATDIVALY